MMMPAMQSLVDPRVTQQKHDQPPTKRKRQTDMDMSQKLEDLIPESKVYADLPAFDQKPDARITRMTSQEGDIREGNKRRHHHFSRNPDDQGNSKPGPHFEINYEQETDPLVIARREKQIEYGKNTPEYHNYIETIPKLERQSFHPRSPNKYRKYSRRAWDGLVRQWRLNLHCWSEFPMSASQDGDNDSDKLNDSFQSEDTEVSTSTSSSIAAKFNNGIKIEIKREFDSDSNDDDDDDDDEEEEEEDEKEIIGKREIKLENKSLAKVKKEVMSTSWADEVDEYLEESKI